MDLTSGTIITLKNNKYIILETLKHNNDDYAFTNEIKNDDTTENYYIFKLLGNEVLLITDTTLINKLLPKFQNKLSKTLENIL